MRRPTTTRKITERTSSTQNPGTRHASSSRALRAPGSSLHRSMKSLSLTMRAPFVAAAYRSIISPPGRRFNPDQCPPPRPLRLHLARRPFLGASGVSGSRVSLAFRVASSTVDGTPGSHPPGGVTGTAGGYEVAGPVRSSERDRSHMVDLGGGPGGGEGAAVVARVPPQPVPGLPVCGVIVDPHPWRLLRVGLAFSGVVAGGMITPAISKPVAHETVRLERKHPIHSQRTIAVPPDQMPDLRLIGPARIAGEPVGLDLSILNPVVLPYGANADAIAAGIVDSGDTHFPVVGVAGLEPEVSPQTLLGTLRVTLGDRPRYECTLQPSVPYPTRRFSRGTVTRVGVAGLEPQVSPQQPPEQT